MSEDNISTDAVDIDVVNAAVNGLEPLVVDELTALKERATTLGITFHPNIGVYKLREKVAAAIEGKPAVPDVPEVTAPTEVVAEVETKAQRAARLRKDANQLVRIRVTCMDPAKKEWLGAMYSVSNSLVGTIKKYVPFNNDEGWHVPQMLLNHLRERTCQIFVSKTNPDGSKSRTGKIIKELAIEVMPALTAVELQELAQRQAMANNQD